MSNLLKETAIRLARSMLAQIPFNTIYSYADNLFDIPELPNNDPKLSQQVAFLKTTQLHQVNYDNLDSQSKFIIRNKDTGEEIQISNRGSSRGEIRGAVLRSVISSELESAPYQTLFELISNAVKSPEYSDMLTMMRGALTGPTAQMSYDGAEMSQAHFDIFSKAVIVSINNKIRSGSLDENLNPRDIRQSDELKERIFSGIDVPALYETSKVLAERPEFIQEQRAAIPHLVKLNGFINQLQAKAIVLDEGGYTKEARIANTLVDDLNQQQASLIKGDISSQEFSDNTRALVQTVKQTSLANMRGVEGILWGIVNALTAISTLGVANMITGRFSIFGRTNDSISKVDNVAEELQQVQQAIAVH